MDFEIGYHVIAADELDSDDTFDEQMSIVEFLRDVQRHKDLPYDLAVRGLDAFLREADDPAAMCQFIHRILRDNVNYLTVRNPRIQFIADGVEYWDDPVLVDDDDHIQLNDIFHGSLSQEGPGLFSSHLNVQS